MNNGKDNIQPTKEHCAEDCSKTPSCAAWTYDPRNGRQYCWFKTSGADRGTKAGVWSGECEGEI